MPEYVYGDGQHTKTVYHAMSDDPLILCDECGAEMHRIPQVFSWVWGGVAPSKGGVHPVVQRYNAARPRLKDEFARKKEEHVNRTANESKSTD